MTKLGLDTAKLKSEVIRRYHVDPRNVRVLFAPYRVCPLGAHIDHQRGHVTAMALDQGIAFAYAPAADGSARVTSLDFPGEVSFGFKRVPHPTSGDWGNYLRGAVRALQQRSELPFGLVGVTQGGVSEGGLSSSAAIGVAYLMALEEVNGLNVTPEENILLDQQIENDYLGLQNGILDPAAILLARRDHLTWIDCESKAYTHHAMPPVSDPFEILIAFSGLRQSLVTTDYNRRVAECAEAAAVLLRACGRSISSPLLGRLSLEEYMEHRNRLEGVPARRAVHFFSEMERVREGIVAWRHGEMERFGRLVVASGESSIRNYECGAPPLITLFELLNETNGVYGSRFSGAGFRGCCLALVDPAKAADAARSVQEAYARRYPELAQEARVVICRSGGGARWISS